MTILPNTFTLNVHASRGGVIRFDGDGEIILIDTRNNYLNSDFHMYIEKLDGETTNKCGIVIIKSYDGEIPINVAYDSSAYIVFTGVSEGVFDHFIEIGCSVFQEKNK